MATILGQRFQLRDWRSGLYLGHQFVRTTNEKGFQRAGDKRCEYCGAWFHWTDAERDLYVRTGNIDVAYGRRERHIVGYTKDDRPIYRSQPPTMVNWEPVHCGSSHCQEYHRRVREGPNVHAITRHDQVTRMQRTFRK